MREKNDSRGFNAIGKPYSPSFDPNYKLKGARTSNARLRSPYLRVKFVGEELRETQWPYRRQQKSNGGQQKPNESTAAQLNWKCNGHKAEFTARAPLSIGGSYILSPFFNCWNVDYREKGGRSRRQLGFAHTLDEAKAIADSWQGDVVAQRGGDEP
jgi:hypothetical protein